MSKNFRDAGKNSTASVQTRPRPGRPTREQAEQRHAQLLDRALDIFLNYGYELATIEEIVGSIGMHKSTAYGLYGDKKALFRAAVEHAILRWKTPTEVFRALESEDLEATLIAIAQLAVKNSTSPMGLKLQRIVIAESFRVPEITQMFWEHGGRPSHQVVVDLLTRRATLGEIQLDQPELMAHGVLTLSVGLMNRMILVGTKLSQSEIDKRIKVYVKLFLNGVRPRPKR